MKRIVVIMAGSSLAAIVVALLSYYAADRPRSTPIVYLAFPDDTNFATGFSEARFNEIHKGMTQDEVIQKLGRPLKDTEVPAQSESASGPSKRWRVYSYSEAGPRHDNYYIRRIVIDSEGHVVDVVSTFYSD